MTRSPALADAAFTFRIDETATTLASALDCLADLLIDLEDNQIEKAVGRRASKARRKFLKDENEPSRECK